MTWRMINKTPPACTPYPPQLKVLVSVSSSVINGACVEFMNSVILR